MGEYFNPTDFKVVQAPAEKILALSRERFGFPNSPPVPVEMIAQALFGLRCESRKLGGLGNRTVGALSKDNRIIYVDERCTWHQYIFAVAHEIGHWVLHEGNHYFKLPFDNGQTIPLSRILGSARAKTKEKKAKFRETEANRFAGALLIPRPFLSSEAEKYEVIDAEAISELAKAFDVSMEAMLYRIKNLHKHGAWSGPRIDWDSLYRLENWFERLRTERRQTEKQTRGGSADQQGQRSRSVGKSEAAKAFDFAKEIGEYLRRQRQNQVVKGGRKKPLIVEFAGTPNAGKDTQAYVISDYLEDVYNYKVRVIDEAIKSCHMDKCSDMERLTKAVALTVVRFYEASFENPGDYDFVIFNRGLFDGLAFVHAAHMRDRISQEQERIHINYLLSYAHLLDIVFLFLISPEESLRREKESRRNFVAKLAERDGASLPDQGVHNKDMLDRLNSSYIYTYYNYKGMFEQIYPLGLSSGDYADISGDQQGVMEMALGLSEMILLQEGSVQLLIPELFDVCYVHPNSSNKAGPAPRRSLPKSCRQSEVQYRRCVQLSFLETIGVA